MSENHDYLRTHQEGTARLRSDITILMLKGAGYAAAFCVAMGLIIWFTYAIGLMLPEESRDTEDPTPFSFELRLEGETFA